MQHNFQFEFSPHLIVLLGEQLIHDKKIALSELVKNSYDADATAVDVDVSQKSITICDDGCGMDINTVKNIWLKPGSSNKQTNDITPKFRRVPIGEKGIGRLGVHKLGNIIELYTKSEYCNEIYLKIDWTNIAEAQSLQDLHLIKVIENIEPKVFKKDSTGKDRTGTKLIITELKDNWESKDYKNLSSDLTNLISPFTSKTERFTINFSKENALFKNTLLDDVEKIKKTALFQFDLIIENGLLKKFNYTFKPWQGLEKVSGRHINLSKHKDRIISHIGKKNKYLDANTELDVFKDIEIGEIKFTGFIYDFDHKLWNTQTEIEKSRRQVIKEYMKLNGGIRVYRDNFRIFNYGEYGHDILELDLERVNRPAGKISSNQILASIRLNRSASKGLVEKTNREGFINNQALECLKKSLGGALDIVSVLKQDDKSRIIKAYLENASDRAGIENRINEIKKLVVSSNIEDEKKLQINDRLDSFTKEFDHIKQVFLSASSTGLNLAIVVHEMRHLTNKLNEKIRQSNWEEVNNLAELLQKTIKNYGDIMRLDKKNSLVSVNALIGTALSNAELRFKTHNVEIVNNMPTNLEISVKKNLVTGIFNNLFDNSLYWLEEQRVENRKILINAYKKDKQLHVIIADNGLGFTISFESALMPLVTGRKDESSMGIGLYLADQVMTAHQGFIVQGDFEEEKLPIEFKYGAIIKLIFRL